jgi:preprotein translocase subunit SecD
VRVAWLVLVAVLALAGCTSRTAGAPETTSTQAKNDLPVVGATDLVVPIVLHPVVEDGSSTGTVLPDPSGEQLTLAEPVMTIERLDRAEVMFLDGAWSLSIDLTDQDSAAFTSWTADHVGERLAMVVDDEVVIAPTIQSAITGDVVQISGDYTRDDVEDLLDKITGR